MNFSKYKLQNYLAEGQATSVGAQGAIDTSMTSSELSNQKSVSRAERKSLTSGSQLKAMSQKSPKSTSGQSFPESKEHLRDLRKEKEFIRMLESSRVDWRQDLQEKAVDGQERENHPYVTVMPTGDENLIQAITQMAKEGKKKKDGVTEEVMLEEKKCKEGYKKDEDGKCVKKKKKSKSTTFIIGRGYGYGHHHDHDDHDDDGDGDGGDGDGGGGGDGGGMGEMFDMLGDMLFNEMSDSKSNK